MFNLVFSRRFAMGHRLIASGSEKCATPHGHNETVTVRLQPVRPVPLDGQANMTEPFERAKAIWHRWIDDHVDHAMQLSEADPLLTWFMRQEPQRLGRILVTPGDPTTEALACCMMAKLNAFLACDGGRLFCAEIRLEETPTNTVTFDGDPVAALAAIAGPDPWWRRPDMSINDIGGARERVGPIAAVAR
ncbi:MAG TPA: 6-carboxytetrahydropterin synthase [Beijerinckiaceae bacterium]|nr:6-carboxytetrahydropterin synthase [Beijerinckiaceae bacterium]